MYKKWLARRTFLFLRHILTLIFLILFCKCGRKSNSKDINADNLIIEGQGVGQFRAGKTKLDDIVKILGETNILKL